MIKKEMPDMDWASIDRTEKPSKRGIEDWQDGDIDEAYEPKDLKRVRDFAKKSGGSFEKEIALARQMAKAITNVDKAIGRAEAAAEVYGGWNEIVEVFYEKAKQLGYSGPEPGRRLSDPTAVLGSKRPDAQRAENQQRSYSYGSRWGGNPILPIGKVNLRTGECKYFNVYDTWDDNSTVEVWRDNKGVDTSRLQNVEPKAPMGSGIGKLLRGKPKEEIDTAMRKFFNYKLVFTSGTRPQYGIGAKKTFYHDQNGSIMGDWEMVDYVPLKHMRELILPYGGNISGYVYK